MQCFRLKLRMQGSLPGANKEEGCNLFARSKMQKLEETIGADMETRAAWEPKVNWN